MITSERFRWLLAALAVSALVLFFFNPKPEPSSEPGSDHAASPALAPTPSPGPRSASLLAPRNDASEPPLPGDPSVEDETVLPIERSRTERELAEARREYAQKRTEIMRSDPNAIPYFRHADRLKDWSETTNKVETERVRDFLSTGTPAEQSAKRELYEFAKDILFISEYYEVGTNPDTAEMTTFAFNNGLIPARLNENVVEKLQHIDQVIGFVPLGPEHAPMLDSSSWLVYEFEQRVPYVEAFLADKLLEQGFPDYVANEMRDSLRAELLSELTEFYGAQSNLPEFRELRDRISRLEAEVEGH